MSSATERSPRASPLFSPHDSSPRSLVVLLAVRAGDVTTGLARRASPRTGEHVAPPRCSSAVTAATAPFESFPKTYFLLYSFKACSTYRFAAAARRGGNRPPRRRPVAGAASRS